MRKPVDSERPAAPKRDDVSGYEYDVAAYERVIGSICREPDDGLRNYRVTVAYWDLSRMVMAYTHALALPDERREHQSASPEQCLLEAAHPVIDHVCFAVEPGAPDEPPQSDAEQNRPANGALDNSIRGIVGRAYSAYRPAVAVEYPVHLNANFCTHATWSSLTLGRDIRNRLLPYRFAGTSSDVVRTVLTKVVIRARRTNNNELAHQLGNGQRTVLWEVGLALLWMIKNGDELDGIIDEPLAEQLKTVGANDDSVNLDDLTDRLAAFVDRRLLLLNIKSLQGPRLPEWRKRDLYLGIASYHLARRFATLARSDAGDPSQGYWKLVAEMVLRGNIFIGGYEQHRVQTYLEYPVVEFGEQFFLQGQPLVARPGHGPALKQRIYAHAAGMLENNLNPLWERFFTDQLLTIQVGEELLRLGRDLPLPPGQGTMFPDELAELRESWLRALIRRYDHSLDDGGQGTQAHLWANFDDRMSFIVNFMRSRAQVAGLWRRPFDIDGEKRVRQDLIPNGDGA